MTSSLESVIILPGRDEAKQATFLDDGGKNSAGEPQNLICYFSLIKKIYFHSCTPELFV